MLLTTLLPWALFLQVQDRQFLVRDWHSSGGSGGEGAAEGGGDSSGSSHLYAVVSTADQRNGQLVVTQLAPGALAGSAADAAGDSPAPAPAPEGPESSSLGDGGNSSAEAGGSSPWVVLQPHSREVEIVDLAVSSSHLALLERKNGTLVATAYPLPSDGARPLPDGAAPLRGKSPCTLLPPRHGWRRELQSVMCLCLLHCSGWQGPVAHGGQTGCLPDHLIRLSPAQPRSLLAGSPLRELPRGQQFSFEAPSYSLWLGDQGPFASALLRVRYSSLTQPLSTYDINMETGGALVSSFGQRGFVLLRTRRDGLAPHAGSMLGRPACRSCARMLSTRGTYLHAPRCHCATQCCASASLGCWALAHHAHVPPPRSIRLILEQQAHPVAVKPRAPCTPPLPAGNRVLKQQQEVQGYDQSKYLARLLWAASTGGVQVPISLAYRAGGCGPASPASPAAPPWGVKARAAAAG